MVDAKYTNLTAIAQTNVAFTQVNVSNIEDTLKELWECKNQVTYYQAYKANVIEFKTHTLEIQDDMKKV